MVVVTIANLGLRYRGERNAGREVSTFGRGTAFPDSALNVSPLIQTRATIPLQRATDELHCRLVVVFRPQCPACSDAARREAAIGTAPVVATTWIAFENDTALSQQFATLVRPESQLGYSANAARVLEIQAVPAAFLIRPDSVVEMIGVYVGGERQLSEFAKLCASLQT